LQEAAAKLGTAIPVYTVEADGPDHARVFTATVTVSNLVTASGTGTSKKHAEMAAALAAWTSLSENA
jgi:ribonuclease-3